jgi:hypothetical protein
MELKYKNWNDITIGVYKELNEILKFERTDDEIMDEVNLSIALLSTLCDADEDEVASLTINDFKALAAQCAFLNEMPKVRIKDKYIINGKEYRVQYNVQDMTMAQYIDYQTFVKEKDKHLSNIIACFLIPKGKKYGDDYNLQEVVDDIEQYFSIVDAHSVCFFFMMLFQSLTKTMLTFLVKKMKKGMKKMTTEEKEKTQEAIDHLNKVISLVKNGDGFTL